MSRKRGRRARQYRLRVRTVRRDPIDYAGLARAALEHAALTQHVDTTAASTKPSLSKQSLENSDNKDATDDGLA